MSEFMIMLRGDFRMWNGMSPDEQEKIMQKYMGWVGKLRAENRFKNGSALNGKSVMLQSTSSGVQVVDGPFAETKEALTGYFVITAANRDEAVEIARGCPALGHGETVEILELSSA